MRRQQGILYPIIFIKNDGQNSKFWFKLEIGLTSKCWTRNEKLVKTGDFSQIKSFVKISVTKTKNLAKNRIF